MLFVEKNCFADRCPALWVLTLMAARYGPVGWRPQTVTRANSMPAMFSELGLPRVSGLALRPASMPAWGALPRVAATRRANLCPAARRAAPKAKRTLRCVA